MRKFLDALLRRKAWTKCKTLPRMRLNLETLEDRLAPTANILVSLDGSYPQQLLREYTPAGGLIRSVVVPPGGAAEDSRDLVADAAGNVFLYNGTFDPYLSTYSTAGSWAHRTHSGWSTVNSTVYGGIGLWNNYAFVTDMYTGGEAADAAKGIVRFNLADSTSARFADTQEFTDLTVGQDGLVYALNTFRDVFVYNPQTMALQRTLTLPTSVGGVTQFYRGLAVNAAGEIFAAGGSTKMVHRFSPSGTLLNSITLAGPGGTFGWVHDIDISTDNRLVLGTTSGHVVQMTTAFTDVTYFSTGSITTVFVAYGLDTGSPPPPPPAPTLSINDVSVTEGNSGSVAATFTVTLSAAAAQAVTVNYATSNGSASAGSDYTAASGALTFNPGETTKTVSVSVLGDTATEPNETFTVNLSGPVNATLFDGQGVGTIVNDDIAPSLAVNDVSVTEGNSGTVNAVFTITLSQASTQTVTVNYTTTASSAAAGVDYQGTSGTLTFTPGQTSRTVAVAVLGDVTDENNEIFFFDLSSPVNATLGDWYGVGTIVDNDTSALSVSDVSVTEGNSGSVAAAFTVSMSVPNSRTVTVSWTTSNGSASAGSDYTAASGALTFNPGETTKTVSVSVLGDTTVESSETFYVNLSNPVNAVIGDGQGVGTIVNDDIAPSLAVNDVSVTEGNSGTVNAVFTITLSQASTQTVTVNYYTGANEALPGSDYQSASGTLTFNPGETSKTVTVVVLGDGVDEDHESFFFNLSNPVNATLGDWYGVGTIVDDDTSLLNVSDATVVEGNSGWTTATFTVTLSIPNSRGVTVNWFTANGTAIADFDYVTASGLAYFNAGETSTTFTVNVRGDTTAEGTETFTVSLFNPVNATIGDGQGVGTIFDDDANSAPTANAGPDQTANEGATVAFDGRSSFDPDGHPLTYLWNFGDGTTGSGPTPNHTYDDNGVYTVTLTVSDGFGGSSSDTAIVTVLNVAPGAHIEGPYGHVRGQLLTFTFSTSEVSAADRAAPMTYAINWGDGTTQTVTGASGYFPLGHVYTAAGTYTVSVTATDKDGGTGPAVNVSITIVAAEMQGGDLYVGGTTGSDQVSVLPVGGGAVRVTINGQDLGTFTLGWLSAPGNGGVIVYAQAGDDTVELVGVDDGSGTPTFPFGAALFGGDDNDTLDARAANGQIIQHGGAGNDVLWGGRGRDLLVGGTGLDWLHGGAGEDLLIGSSTIYDNDFIALASLSAEWVRTDADFATRVAHLNGELYGGYNGDRYLTALTVIDDLAADEVFGGAGADWFFRTGGGSGGLDRANDLDGSDLSTVV